MPLSGVNPTFSAEPLHQEEARYDQFDSGKEARKAAIRKAAKGKAVAFCVRGQDVDPGKIERRQKRRKELHFDVGSPTYLSSRKCGFHRSLL
jgi:hypothetical protein